MRIKIVLLPPFAESKVLLPVPVATKTITQLKKHLLRSLSAVAQHAASHRELVLEIDGFELLGGSELCVIETADVVSVRLAPGSSKIDVLTTKVSANNGDSSGAKSKANIKGNKRKSIPAVSSEDAQVDKKRKTTSESLYQPKSAAILLSTSVRPEAMEAQLSPLKRSRSSSTPSSSGSSSSSASSSSASSDVSSSSTSSSSSSSGSTSSALSSQAAPKSVPLKPSLALTSTANAYPVLDKTMTSNTSPSPHIPPGQGTSQTQNRNQRRRRARQFKKLAGAERTNSAQTSTSTPTPAPTYTHPPIAFADSHPIGSTSVRDTPTATPPKSMVVSQSQPLTQTLNGTTTFTTSGLPIPKDMSNRNKKKGFLREMVDMQGTKTVFDEADDGREASEGPGSAVEMALDVRHPEDLETGMEMEEQTGGEKGRPASETSHHTTAAAAEETPRWTRVVPPSEMVDLPSNVFVTSAVFEQIRAPGGGRRVKNKRRRMQSPEQLQDQSIVEEEAANAASTEMGDSRPLGLTGQAEAGDAGVIDVLDPVAWERVEETFDSQRSLSIDAYKILKVGQMLCCKQVELDLYTFSPALNTQIWEIGNKLENGVLVLNKLPRPAIADGNEWYADAEEGMAVDGGSEIVMLSEADVGEGHWRVL